jgi:hypothetical protein
MVDALHSKCSIFTDVSVQVRPPVPLKKGRPIGRPFSFFVSTFHPGMDNDNLVEDQRSP